MTTAIRETTTNSRRLGRSVAAIVVGFIAVVILSLGTDEVFHLLKVYPPWGQSMSNALFALATAYRLVYGVVGSYITARMAPYRPMQHALIGGAIGTVIATAGAIATWNHTELGPNWYPLALVVTALPCAWLGGKLYESKRLQSNA